MPATPAPARTDPPSPAALAALAAVLLATVAAYLPALDGAFLFDDQALLGNPLVLAPLDQPFSAWAAEPRPLTTLTFALDHAAGGLDPRGWHLASLAVHLGVVLLGWALLRRLFRRAGLDRPEGPALAAAALFALHPLQSEAVAYLSQRAEALAAAFSLAALLALLARDDERAPRRRLALLAGGAALQALGLAAKPTAATLPAAWLLLAALLPPEAERAATPLARARSRLAAAAPLVALSLLSAVSQLAPTAGSIDVGFDIPGLSPAAYLATQLRAVPTYLRLALWPAGQSADWAFAPSAGLGDPWALAGGALLLALAALAWRGATRSAGAPGDGPAAARIAGAGVLLFLVALLPSSSLVPLRDLLAEHRPYLGLLGLAAAAAAGATAALRRLAPGRAPLAGGALLALALVALGAATARRAAVWTTPLALWSDAAAKGPGKARPQLNLGTALFLEGRFEEALAAYRRAAALASDRSVEPELVLEDVAAALLRLGRVDEARAELEAATRASARPAHAWALLAQLEFAVDRFPEAERAAERALALDPRSPLARKYLGGLRSATGALPEARALLSSAAAALPRDVATWLELGRVEERLGDRAAACAAYARAALLPGDPPLAAEAARAAQALGCR